MSGKDYHVVNVGTGKWKQPKPKRKIGDKSKLLKAIVQNMTKATSKETDQ